MVIKTKFDIGQEVYPKLQRGRAGIIIRIFVGNETYHEYHVKFESGDVEPFNEYEILTEEDYNTYRIIKGDNYGEEG